MKVLFDTSVLVAALVSTHPHHEKTFPWLLKALGKEIDYFVCTHTLAETWSVLTRLSVKPRIQPDIAHRLIRENISSKATMIALEAVEYLAVLDKMNAQLMTGGVVYDALLVQAFEKAHCDKLLTLNERDFKRLLPNNEDKLIVPV